RISPLDPEHSLYCRSFVSDGDRNRLPSQYFGDNSRSGLALLRFRSQKGKYTLLGDASPINSRQHAHKIWCQFLEPIRVVCGVALKVVGREQLQICRWMFAQLEQVFLTCFLFEVLGNERATELLHILAHAVADAHQYTWGKISSSEESRKGIDPECPR